MTKWRKYSDQTEYAGEPAAKLYKHGEIRFNQAAGDLWFSDCDHVEIYVSEEDDELAFKPAPESAGGTWGYRRDSDGNSGVISIRSVLSQYGLWHERIDESISVPIRWDDDGELVAVDLSEAVERWGMSSPKSVRRKQGDGDE